MYRTVKITVALLAGVAAIGVVAVVAVPIVARSVNLDPSALVQQVVPTVFAAPDAAASASGADTTNWTLDPSSTVAYRADLSGRISVSGSTNQVSGVIALSDDRVTDAEFMLDLATLSSGDGVRDTLLQALVAATGENTTASFVLTQPVALGDDGSTVTVPVVGVLTLRGISNQVDADAQLSFSGGTGTMTASIPVDLESYGISLADLGVPDDSGTAYIDVDLVATPAE